MPSLGYPTSDVVGSVHHICKIMLLVIREVLPLVTQNIHNSNPIKSSFPLVIRMISMHHVVVLRVFVLSLFDGWDPLLRCYSDLVTRRITYWIITGSVCIWVELEYYNFFLLIMLIFSPSSNIKKNFPFSNSKFFLLALYVMWKKVIKMTQIRLHLSPSESNPSLMFSKPWPQQQFFF